MAPPEVAQTERTTVQSTRRDLSVLLLDLETDLPLAGVPLLLQAGDPPHAIEGSSDAEGRFSFAGLQPGNYTLAPGPLGDLDFRADPVPIEVTDAALEEVVLRVERRWFLAGSVIETGSRLPVPNVGLMAGNPTGRRSYLGASRQDGSFRSEKSFAAGRLALFLAQRETQGLVRNVGNGPELLQVEVGEVDVTRLVVELEWVGVLQGVVLDPLDQPIPEALVRVLSGDSIYLRNASLRSWALYEGLREEGRTVRSDAQGRFAFGRLPNDRNLVLVASAPGFASDRSPELSPPFIVGDDRVELRLANGGSIVGRVLDAQEKPMPEVTVTALSSDTDFQPDPTMTDESGAFRLVGLKSGDTEVTAKARGEDWRRHVVASGEASVVAGEEVELILHAGADGVHLSGTAVDQFGRPITRDRMPLTLRSTPLEPLPGEASWGADSPLEADGTFDVTVSRQADYRLTLLSSTAGERWESLDVRAPAQDLLLTYTIVPTSVLTVRVRDGESGELINQGSYSISWDRGSLGGNFGGGTHHTQIREGLYTLTVDASGYAPKSRQLDLRSGLEPETPVEMRLDRGRRLTGVVVGASGEPVKGSTIALRLGGLLQLENLVYSGADGHFAIDSVPLTGGSVCVIDEAYRTLAVAEIGTGDVVLTID
jgi:hypothetical protein